MKSALPNRTAGALSANMQRSSLFRSDNDAIRRQIGSNPFVWQVMTPFDLDNLINPPEKKEAKVKDPNSIAELKKR